MSTSRSMSPSETFILGAPDPEMEAIERLLREAGERVIYALGPDGARVRPADAYRVAALSEPVGAGSTVYRVECAGPAIPADAVVIDHHRIGDPGYGRPPAEFLPASSVGQVCRWLGIEPTPEILLTAAADHCLAAAYRGECPGVDPDALMRWRVKTRAAHQGRSPEEILADVERAREALRSAPVVVLSHRHIERTTQHCFDGISCAVDLDGLGICGCACDGCTGQAELVVRWERVARDMRGRHVPELPEASAREGECFIASLTERDGRVKVVCQSGTPEQIEAFMHTWAPAQELTDIYGDPARGFAGGFMRGLT